MGNFDYLIEPFCPSIFGNAENEDLKKGKLKVVTEFWIEKCIQVVFLLIIRSQDWLMPMKMLFLNRCDVLRKVL
jgi:hypothetical protein